MEINFSLPARGRAAVLTAIGQDLELQEIPVPQPGPGQALVQIHAAALNHRDVWIQKHGLYPNIKLPAILGSDGAGMVVAVGPETGFGSSLVGQEVILNPSMNWGPNPVVQASDYHILGMPTAGTFAEYCLVPMANVVPKPAHLQVETAAALPLAGLTAFRALFVRGGLRKGEKVLITGAGGGAALLGAQMALAAGAEVAFTTGSEAKADQLRKLLPGLGASAVYKNPSWHKDLAKTAGTFDLILDSAGGEDFSRLVDLASPGGKIAFFGATHGNPSAFPLAKVFWKQLSILGSTMGSEADFQTFISFVNQHRIVPVVDQVFPFQDIQKAFNRMESGSQTGKIVIKIRN